MFMGTCRKTALVAALALAWANLANGDVLADASSVRGIISERCIGCHQVPGFPQDRHSRSLTAPGFVEIANNPDVYSHERLQKFLARPHFPMRQFTLSQRNIQDLIAFIKSLKSED